MPLEYNKKQRIHKTGASPRDLQNRLNNKSSELPPQYNSTIMDLMLQVASLTTEVKNLNLEGSSTYPAKVVSEDKKYTEDEFNYELTKALKKELTNVELKLEAKDDKIYALELKIEALVEINKSQTNVNLYHTSEEEGEEEEEVKITKRPVMEGTVIDPTEHGKSLESHINIEEVELETKNNMETKVDKLKELFGGK